MSDLPLLSLAQMGSLHRTDLKARLTARTVNGPRPPWRGQRLVTSNNRLPAAGHIE
jgi:hypothetical protein